MNHEGTATEDLINSKRLANSGSPSYLHIYNVRFVRKILNAILTDVFFYHCSCSLLLTLTMFKLFFAASLISLAVAASFGGDKKYGTFNLCTDGGCLYNANGEIKYSHD